MIIDKPLKQQNLGPVAAVLLMTILLLSISLITADNPLEGVSGGHGNHTDTQVEKLPGNTCPNGCPWPDCGCNGPVLTLQPTVYISPIPTLISPNTPDIPDPSGGQATVFPTLEIDPLPTAPATMPIPTLMPVDTPPAIPTIEPSIRDVDNLDGSGGGLD